MGNIGGKLLILVGCHDRLKMIKMGETSTLTTATTGKESLRTTVPMSVLKQFNLKAGDKLDWNFDVKDGEIILLVKPLKQL